MCTRAVLAPCWIKLFVFESVDGVMLLSMCVSSGFLTWLFGAAMCCCFAIGVLLCLQRPVRCRQYLISSLVVTQLPSTA